MLTPDFFLVKNLTTLIRNRIKIDMAKLVNTAVIDQYEKVINQIPEVVLKHNLSRERISALSGIPIATLKRRLKTRKFSIEESKNVAEAINNYLKP